MRSIDVEKPGHDTVAFTALPRYFSAMIAWTNIEERHAVKIARHPVLHAAFRGACRHRDMRWRFQHVPVRHGARSRGRHVSWSVLDGAFAGLMPDGAVLAFDRRQRGTFRKSFEEYAATRIIPARIKRAKQLCSATAPYSHARIERQFGVPATLLMAIWTLESDNGTGDMASCP
ncbi:MAG TPA: lytic murein transglycosylase [Xanthobacteraceae bacterium]|nr:lytic murein transglycosylase [Xanthobacteraceae bacterium]